MSARPLGVFALAALFSVPGSAAAQCGIDIVEQGVEAYRDLQLSTAIGLLERVVADNGDSFSCATVNARALTYLGATYWLAEQPDAAERAFERAIVQAPRHQPDPIEFPPALTDLFETVRRDTPAVALEAPDAVDIGPRDAGALAVRVLASNDHWVDAIVRSSGGDVVREVYEGLVVTGPQGISIEWDGRGSGGELVDPGRYELEVVSLVGRTQPARKVVVPLTVESVAPAGPALPAYDTARLRAGAGQAEGAADWKAYATGGVGLLAGAFVVAMPTVVEGAPESWLRYPVAGGLAAAGIVGMIRRLDEDRDPFTAAGDSVVATPTSGRQTGSSTIHIRVGYQHRAELGGDPTGAGISGRGVG